MSFGEPFYFVYRKKCRGKIHIETFARVAHDWALRTGACRNSEHMRTLNGDEKSRH